MTATVSIVGLEIEHSTSESWRLELPVELAATRAATIAALVGATAQLVLVGRSLTQQPMEILFQGEACQVIDDRIVTEAPPSFFADKAGAYEGSVLLRLASGFVTRTHEIKLKVVATPSWRSVP